ncbi:MAG: winged helix-turn-helix domain-containing protein [Sphingomonadaceae bacterium]
MRIGPLKLKLQLMCGDAVAFGPGKADLLDAIAREGSIAASGRALGMSYRRTWLLVDEMNRCFETKLVETLSGGGRERGARVTVQGKSVLAAYRTLERDTAAIHDSEIYRQLVQHLRDMPTPVKTLPPGD